MNIFAYKVCKQICLVGIWFTLGLYLEILGPTLPDLGDFLGVNYETLGRALALRSVGLFLGSFGGGMLHERFYRHTDLFLSLGLMIGAVGITLVPWIRLLSVVSFSLALTGFSEGVINSGGNMMVMDLWGVNAASPMHSLHFGFALGAMIVPQIARPFLAPRSHASEISLNHTLNGEISAILTATGDSIETETIQPSNSTQPFVSKLHYPFTIVGIVTFLMALIMLCFYILGPPKEMRHRKGTKTILRLFNPGSCANDNVGYGTVLLFLLALFFVQAVGGERAYGKYLYSYAIKSDVNFDRDEAASLNTVFWLSHMCGRAGGTVVAKFLHVRYILAGDILGSIISSVILCTAGYGEALVLWIFSCFMGIFISVLFPAAMAWSNLHLKMNSMGVMVFLMGGACGAFIYQYSLGYLFDVIGPRSLMYVMVAYGILAGVNFIALECLVSRFDNAIFGSSLETIPVNNRNININYDDDYKETERVER